MSKTPAAWASAQSVNGRPGEVVVEGVDEARADDRIQAIEADADAGHGHREAGRQHPVHRRENEAAAVGILALTPPGAVKPALRAGGALQAFAALEGGDGKGLHRHPGNIAGHGKGVVKALG